MDPQSHWPLLRAVAERFGTPSFVYFATEIERALAGIQHHLGEWFQVQYAVKTNPLPALLRFLHPRIAALDISSAGEFDRAVAAGWEPARLRFTGPAKTDAQLRHALLGGAGAIVLESVGEAQRLSALAAESSRTQVVLVRIAPASLPAGFGVRMSGKPCQFGIDEEQALEAIGQIQQLPGLLLRGLHVYAGTQCLNAAAIAENYANCCALFTRLCDARAIRPDVLVFGSGLGIRYQEDDRAVDLAAVAAGARDSLNQLRSHFPETRLLLETGRYIVGEAGYYLVRVVASKCSRGTQIRLCDGGMNHHLGAAGHLGQVIARNYRMGKLSDPSGPPAPFDIYGPLCTSIDCLARGVQLPGLEIGDIIAIASSGAYGPTASPLHFISHEPPNEIWLPTDDIATARL